MAIQAVQSISGNGGGATTSFSLTLGQSAVEGNFLLWFTSAWEDNTAGGPPSNATLPSGLGTWNTTTDVGTSGTLGDARPIIYYNENCSAGTQVTIDYGTTFFIVGCLAEFSGLVSSGSLDQQGGTGNQESSTPSTSMDSTVQADTLVVAALNVDSSDADVEIDIPATTGYTNLHVDQNPLANAGASFDYKIVSSVGTQSAAWGTLDASRRWSAKIAAFKAAVASSVLRVVSSPMRW